MPLTNALLLLPVCGEVAAGADTGSDMEEEVDEPSELLSPDVSFNARAGDAAEVLVALRLVLLACLSSGPVSQGLLKEKSGAAQAPARQSGLSYAFITKSVSGSVMVPSRACRVSFV